MLRSVVVENYVIFKDRHELDFEDKDGCHFYTFVGENATGKSSLVALIKAACNLQEEGPDFEVISNGKGESKVVCQFEFSDSQELIKLCEDSSSTAGNSTRVAAGLSSWFSDDILKIPAVLLQPIKIACHNSVSSGLQVLVGHRHQPTRTTHPGKQLDSLTNSQFIYIIMEEEIFVATKSGGTLTTGFHKPLPGGVNPMDWIPQQSFLLNITTVPYSETVSKSASSTSFESFLQTHYDDKAVHTPNDITMVTGDHGDQLPIAEVDGGAIQRNDSASMATSQECDTCDPGQPIECKENVSRYFRRVSSFGGLAWSNYHELKKLIVSDLLRGFPHESLADIHPLFHEIIGNKSISFELNLSHKESFQVVDTKTNRVMRRIPEGVFTAFIIAALLVKPRARNIILDEPTRGMHPLQSRRLRNILTRESIIRRKCIIAASHSPELLDVDRITLIWRFQLLPNGYCQIRRVTARYTERELLFIGGGEVREIFFSRYIIWVEGESDKRFIEALLGLFDEGRSELWKVLLEPNKTRGTSEARGSQARPHPRSYDAFIATLFEQPAYERKYFTREQLTNVQEAVRSCKVVSIGGKKNIWKGTAICRDLRIPFAVICDLDAIIPNSRENSVLSQFERCEGDWDIAMIPHAKTKLLDDEESPASKSLDETDNQHRAKLKSLRNVGDVMRFYDKELYIFTWWLMGGEIEDAVRLTRAQFGKKLWPDMLSAELKELILSLLDPKKLISKEPTSKDAEKQANLEILRCIYFIIRFFNETLQDI